MREQRAPQAAAWTAPRHALLPPTRERLPWPQAVLLMGLLSLGLWALIAAVVLLAIR